MSQRRIVGVLAALACSTTLILTACSSGGSPQNGTSGPAAPAAKSPREAENKAILISRQDPGTLDYTVSVQTALLLWVPGNVVEPLLSRGADGEIGSGLADFTVDDARTTYTFTLKENKFSDGSAITIDDVVYSMETMQKSPVANNAGAYAQVTSIEKTGDADITVKLKQPSQAFLQGMAGVPGLIQPAAAASSIATKPIGSGPYQIDEYTSNSRIVMTANPNFQGEAPALKNIELRIIPDGAAVINALKSGEVDGMPHMANDLWERMRSEQLDKSMTLIKNDGAGEKQYLVLNQEGELTKNKEVRQAFAASLDRHQLIEAVNADWAMTATCDYGLGSDPWVKQESADTCPNPADPAKAKEMAGKLGLGDKAAHFVSLSDVPDLSLPADVLIEQFKANGITVDREAIDLARYSQTIFQGRPPQFEVTNMSDPAGITQFICPDPTKAGWTTYCSAEFTDLVAEADLAPTIADYNDLLGKANDQLKEDAVIVPLTNTQQIGLAHPELEGMDTKATVSQEIPLYALHW